MVGNGKLPVLVVDRLAVFRQFEPVVGALHVVQLSPFSDESKVEANTHKLGVATVEAVFGRGRRSR
jgi:hypothetical protein